MACVCKKSGFVFVLLTVIIRFSPSVAVTNPADTLALQAFRKTLQDPDFHLENWKGNNPCEMGWYGVFCAPPTGPNNITFIMELRLFQLNLTGSLAPELGGLSQLMILNVMWNKLTGSIPSSFQQLSNLQLLLLNGNQLSGFLPPELGQLSQLNRIQIDQNRITGPIPSAFGGLRSIEHLHMNDNLLNGTIPEELGALPNLVHLLLDSNSFSGALPPEIANAPMLQIIQLDNNLFGTNATFPTTWGNISTLLKLSVRNCGISGIIPDLSNLTSLSVLDLSFNNLTGTIPFSSVLPTNLRSLDLSNNLLTGQIPNSVGDLQFLEVLMLRNNWLDGPIPQTLGTTPIFQSKNYSSVIDLQNNNFGELTNQTLATLVATSHTAVRLAGNPKICPTSSNSTTVNPLCIFDLDSVVQFDAVSVVEHPYNACQNCLPITVGYRLKSPGFTVFDRYDTPFTTHLSNGLNLSYHQVVLRDYTWQRGPRLAMTIQLLPERNTTFNDSEFDRLYRTFSDWLIPDSNLFGPYEMITFDPRGAPTAGPAESQEGLSAGAVAGIVLGVTGFAVLVTSLVLFLVGRRHRTPTILRAQMSQLVRMARAKKNPALKHAGVKFFTFKELSKATNRFDVDNEIGAGGYGKVYKATLEAEKKLVAVKRAARDSRRGDNQFYTEIEMLSRCHHRNLLGLVGYCDDEGEQMLVYEYMAGGNLRHQLESHKNGGAPLDFPTRLRIAVGSARGLLYLHTEADPPIIHRDIKPSNILLDDFKVAKVADFGLSKQAPVPDTHGHTPNHISTGVKGTPGYIDPEYILTSQLTEKSDVYSFGAVLLELITGTRVITRGKNIVEEARRLTNDPRKLLTLVDPDVVHYPWTTLALFMQLALRCCEEMSENRPDMAEVVRNLESIATSSSDTSSSPDRSYTLDIAHPNEDHIPYHWDDSRNSVHSASVTDHETRDTVELLSKTVTYVGAR